LTEAAAPARRRVEDLPLRTDQRKGERDSAVCVRRDRKRHRRRCL